MLLLLEKLEILPRIWWAKLRRHNHIYVCREDVSKELEEYLLKKGYKYYLTDLIPVIVTFPEFRFVHMDAMITW